MKHRLNFSILTGIAFIIALSVWPLYTHSLTYVHGAQEDRQGLWMAALKGIGGSPYYVGSDGDYSFFRAGTFLCSRYKAPTAKLRLPGTFPFGAGTPYVVTQDMAPPSP
jgi:hypothetical protein